VRYTAWVPAAEGERFGPGAFDGQVGRATRLNFFGTAIGWATIVSAEVAGDGSGVTLTFDAELQEPSGE
jgi:hypothetical protein